MPPVSHQYLLDNFLAMGMYVPTGTGPEPFTQQDIGWWQYNSRIRLSPWEAEVIWSLSREYLSEFIAAKAKDRAPPYFGSDIAARRADVAARIDKVLGK